MFSAMDLLLWGVPLTLAFLAAKKAPFKERAASALKRLGLARLRLLYTLKHAVILFAALFAASLVFGFIVDAMGLNDTAPVEKAVREGLANPFAFGLLLLVRVMGEELFFRGLLVPYIGVLPSSLLFGLAHIGFNSTAQIAAAFLLGLLLAYAFYRTRNLYVPFLAHLGFNATTVLSVMGAGA